MRACGFESRLGHQYFGPTRLGILSSGDEVAVVFGADAAPFGAGTGIYQLQAIGDVALPYFSMQRVSDAT